MPSKRSPEEIEIIFDFLSMDFEQGDETADDSSIGHDLIELIQWRERLRYGAENQPKQWPALDTQTLRKMQSWGTEEFEFLLSMTVFRKLANGETASAIRTLKKAIEHRSKALSKSQTEKARKLRPKRKHPLSTMVDTIVAQNPTISVNDLFNELRRISKTNPASPCSFDFSKLAFISLDSSYPNIPKKSLGDYLYRSKKKTR